MKKLFFLLALLAAAGVQAQVNLPKILSSHMVVQRDLPVHVWGLASPGDNVTVSFRGETRTTAASRIGRWSLYLKPGVAGGPFQMTVTSAPSSPEAKVSTITLDDVLVGDVWVASGQSNMEFQLHSASTADQDIPKAKNDRIRLLIVKRTAVDFPQDDIDFNETIQGWVPSAPETAKDFSAVGWYFAREIEQREHVPVGVIDSSWGGTPVEAWTRLTAIGEDAALAPAIASWGRMTEEQTDARLEEKDRQKQSDEAKAKGMPAPVFPWHPELESWSPGYLYNGMIAPLTPFPIRGAIWYQGESNTLPDRAHLYQRAFAAMIQDWRRQWGVGDFPFLFVQISNFKSTPFQEWPTLRDQQLRTLALRNTGMAVTIDIGNPDNVHPTNKLDVGIRLARAARAISYGEAVEYNGPLFRQATPEGKAIRAWFDHAAGLMTKESAVPGFEVAGKDLKFSPATARIDGTTVVAESPDVPEPLYVRYGWANSPDCSLFNSEGLPASPFNSVP